MDAVLEGRDSLVVLPTGGGKSLCFQAPALLREGLALVVSPLISLMKDQVDTLIANGVSAAYYNSTLSSDQKSTIAAGVREGRYRMLYVAPERLVGDGSEAFLSLVAQRPMQLCRHRRSALHQPMGTRLPARISSTAAAPRPASRRQPSCVYRHGDCARPARHRRRSSASRCARDCRIL